MSLTRRWHGLLDSAYETPVEVLAVYRIVFACSLLLHGGPRVAWLASLPPSLLDPPNGLPMVWAGVDLGAPMLVVVEVGWVALVVALGVGYRTRLISPVLSIWWVVASAMAFSIGKIDHSILIVLVPLFMARSGWGDAYSVDASREHTSREGSSSGFPIGAYSLVVAFGFFTAAMPKAEGGWLDPRTQAARLHFETDYTLRDRTEYLADYAMRIDFAPLWEMADIATIALELALVATVLRPRFYRRALVLVGLFHLCNTLVLNINFGQMLVVYVLFALPAAAPRWMTHTQRSLPVWVAAMMGVLALGTIGWDSGYAALSALTGIDLGWIGIVDVVVATTVLVMLVGYRWNDRMDVPASPRASSLV